MARRRSSATHQRTPNRTTRHRHSKKNRQRRIRKKLISLMLIILALLGAVMFHSCMRVIDLSEIDYPDYVVQDIITIDGHSRTGKEMRHVNDIVIHYVANPGSTAQGNRDYFESSQSKVSAHFVVGLEGEVIQCIPLNEQSSASNQRNRDTISIEVCHPDASGKFSQVTYDRLVELTAWLCSEFKLDENDVIRHYDVTGKKCPLYYVEHEDAWEQLKADIGAEIGGK